MYLIIILFQRIKTCNFLFPVLFKGRESNVKTTGAIYRNSIVLPDVSVWKSKAQFWHFYDF
jgi:hypothetical protein